MYRRNFSNRSPHNFEVFQLHSGLPSKYRRFHVCTLRFLWHMYLRLMATIFDSPVILTTESIHNSPSVLPDPENVKVAVGISSISCIQAEIFTIAYVLPVNGGHLWSSWSPWRRKVLTLVPPHGWTSKMMLPVGILIITHWNHVISFTSSLTAAILIFWAWLGILWNLKHQRECTCVLLPISENCMENSNPFPRCSGGCSFGPHTRTGKD